MKIFQTNLSRGVRVNLDEEYQKSPVDFTNPDASQRWIEEIHKRLGANYSYGSFLEDRSRLLEHNSYGTNPLYQSKKVIHIGMDINVPAGTQIVLPEEGQLIHVMEDNGEIDGWGGRAIFKLKRTGDYLIFGHLELITLPIGVHYPVRMPVSKIAEPHKNGRWFPHLHLQLIDQEFFNSFGRLEDIDGYLPEGDPLLAHVKNPEEIL
jgi:hypothetical protein